MNKCCLLFRNANPIFFASPSKQLKFLKKSQKHSKGTYFQNRMKSNFVQFLPAAAARPHLTAQILGLLSRQSFLVDYLSFCKTTPLRNAQKKVKSVICTIGICTLASKERVQKWSNDLSLFPLTIGLHKARPSYFSRCRIYAQVWSICTIFFVKHRSYWQYPKLGLSLQKMKNLLLARLC